MQTLIIQAERQGVCIKIVKVNKCFQVIDNRENELGNVTFMNCAQALNKFNEKVETIIQ